MRHRTHIAFWMAAAALIAGREAPAVAQVHTWSQRFGGTGQDLARAVAVDGSGNVVIVGTCTSVTDFGGGNIFTTANSGDIFVAKFDANGVHQWSRGFPGSGQTDDGFGVAVDGSGNVAITGSFTGTIDFGGGDLISAGGTDIVVAKYSAGGAHLWSKRFGNSTNNEVGNAVAMDASGNVVVTGQFAGSVDFGGGPLTASATSVDIYIVKFDANGAHQWSQGFGSTQADVGYGIDVDGSGNVVVTGSFQGTVNFGGGGLTSLGSLEIFLAKYDASGAHQWSKRLGSTGGEIGRAVVADASGNVVVTGSFAQTVNFGGVPILSAGGSDVFVAKYDASGVHQWSRGFGGTSNDDGYGVAVDAAGDVAITGYFRDTADFGGDDLISAGENDIFVARYSAGGVYQWSKRFGDIGFDSGRGVAMNGPGDVVATGDFKGIVDFGGGPFEAAFGSNDIFLTKYATSVTGVGDTSTLRALSVLAYPNPFNPGTTIRYTVTESGRVQVRVYDVQGRPIATLVNEESSVGPHTVRWEGRDSEGVGVSSGVYFVRLEQNGVVRTKRITLLK
jgi:hypothetical protein